MFVEHELEKKWFLTIWYLVNLVIVMHWLIQSTNEVEHFNALTFIVEVDQQLEGVMGIRDVIAQNSAPPPVHLRDFAITIC